MTIEGKTVGLVGLGSIGKIVARLLAGFGCTILAYDPFVDPAQADAAGIQLRPLEVISRSDFVSLHCPVTAEARGLVDAAFLARMKPGAFIINTARGELVDEDALYGALVSGSWPVQPGCLRQPAARRRQPAAEAAPGDLDLAHGRPHRQRRAPWAGR